MNKRLAPLISTLLILLSVSAKAVENSKGINFQAVIRQPDGQLPTVQGVTVTIQILDPVANCVLREEEHLGVNISNGYLNLVIGNQNATTPSARNPSPVLSLRQVMDNSTPKAGLRCIDGQNNIVTTNQTYTPVESHQRKMRLRVAIGNETVVADFNMRSVPYAISAETIDGKKASDFLQSNGTANATQTNLEQFFTQITSAPGAAVKWNGSAFVTYDPTDGQNLATSTVAGDSLVSVPWSKVTGVPTPLQQIGATTCADGKILKMVSGVWTCVDEGGIYNETDPTVSAFAKTTPGAGLTVSAGKIVPDFGTGAGKVVEGNDSRLSDGRAPIGAATGDLSGSYPNPTVKGLQGYALAGTTPGDGQLYRWNNSNSQWEPKFIGAADLKKSDGTPQMPAACGASQTLAWSSVADSFSCADIGSLDASKITTGTLAYARLPVGTAANTVAAGDDSRFGDAQKIQGRTVDGTAPTDQQVLVWSTAGSRWQPANLPSAPVSSVAGRSGAVTLDAADIGSGSGKYLTYKPDNTACSTGQVLKWTAASRWECANDADAAAGGFVSSVTVSGAVTNSGTATAPVLGVAAGSTSSAGIVQLATNGGTTANTVVQATDSRLSDSRAPNGSATGDLTGSYPAPTVAKIQGTAVSTTAPTAAQFLVYNGTTQYAPITMGGDATIAANGTLTLASTTVTGGAYGSGTQVPSYTVDAKGRLTAASNVAIAFPVTSVASKTGAVTLDWGDIQDGVGKYLAYKPNNAACADQQVLKWDGTNSRWICANDAGAAGVVTSVSVSAPVTNSGTATAPVIGIAAATTAASGAVTLAADGGTTASTVVQATDSRLSNSRAPNGSATGDLSGTYPAPTVAKLQGTAVSATAPTSAQVLVYNGTNWAPTTFGIGNLKTSLGAAQFASAACTDSQTLTWSALTDAFTCVNINNLDAGKITAGTLAYARLPVGTAANTVAAGDDSRFNNATKLQGRDLVSTAPTAGQVLTWNNVASQWEPSTPSSAPVTSVSVTAPVQNIGSASAPNISISSATTGASGVVTLAADGGTTASTVVQATDSRLSNSRAPNGSATGDLSGTYPAPTVAKIQGVSVAATAPTAGQMLVYNGTTQYAPVSVSGDATLGSAGALTLANTTVTGGSYGSTTQVATFTVDSKGRLTAAANAAIAFPVTSVAGRTGDVTLDASDLTSAAGKYLTYKPNNVSCTDQQVLKWDNTNTRWVCANESTAGGFVASVAVTAPITNSGTATAPNLGVSAGSTSAAGVVQLATNGGTTANTVVQATDSRLSDSRAPNGTASGDLSGTYPSPTVAKLQGTAVSASAPTSGTFLKYNGTNWAGTALAVSDISGLSTTLGNKIDASQMPANCTAGQTLTFSSPTGTWTCSTLAVTAANFSSQTAKTFLAAPTGAAGAPTFRVLAAGDLPAGGYDTSYAKLGGNTAGAAITLGTADTFGLQLATNGSTRVTVDATGKVGVGTGSPAAKLDVAGQIRSSSYNAGSATAIDWANGNVQYTSANCQAMTFSNMLDGGSYTLIVTGATAGTCTFSQTSAPDTVASGSFKFNPANAATTASTITTYTFLRYGSNVVVSWITGFQ